MPPIAIGSHLDTQPTGGKFDGVLGVLGALEALRTLVEAGYETFAPIEIVNWTNEEGARFAPAMVSSGVFAGAFDPEWASSRQDRSGTTFRDALEAIGYHGTQRCGHHPLSAFFELHIEQGPMLEPEGKGHRHRHRHPGHSLVRGDRARRGRATAARRRCLCGRMRWSARRGWSSASTKSRFNMHRSRSAPSGLLEVKPNSPNVVPGEVFFTVDHRHPDAAMLDAMEQAWTGAPTAICDRSRPRGRGSKDSRSAAGPLRSRLHRLRARGRSDRPGLSAREIVSGAGHDAGYVSRWRRPRWCSCRAATGSVTTRRSIRSKEQCAAGAQVLLQAVLNYDRRLAERHGSRRDAALHRLSRDRAADIPPRSPRRRRRVI